MDFSVTDTTASGKYSCYVPMVKQAVIHEADSKNLCSLAAVIFFSPDGCMSGMSNISKRLNQ